MTETVFEDFLGENVKAPYKDGTQYKIARGKLLEVKDGFVKIQGELGTIIINQKNIHKMGKIKEG